MINHTNQNYEKITVIKKETIKNTEANENYKKGNDQHVSVLQDNILKLWMSMKFKKKSHKKVKYLWEVSLEQKQNVCAALPSEAIQII